MGACRECRYWTAMDHGDREYHVLPDGWGRCDRIGPNTTDRDLGAGAVMDTDGDIPELFTGAGFGCTAFGSRVAADPSHPVAGAVAAGEAD